MDARTRRRWPLWALALALLAARAAPAEAATYLRSSLKPTCLTADCSRIQFVLNVASDVHVDWVLLSSSDPEKWKFRSLLSAEDANDQSLAWQWQLGAPWSQAQDGLYLKAGGFLAPEPIHLTVEMVTYTAQYLYAGTLAWSGLGNTLPGGGEATQVIFGGTVTPEPDALLLLGTGMLGLAALRRRRRRAPAAPA